MTTQFSSLILYSQQKPNWQPENEDQQLTQRLSQQRYSKGKYLSITQPYTRQSQTKDTSAQRLGIQSGPKQTTKYQGKVVKITKLDKQMTPTSHSFIQLINFHNLLFQTP